MMAIEKRTGTPACEVGVVEGFFGPPWTHEGRRRFIRFMADAGLPTYIYAPKDDLFHRENWSAPYPPREFEELLKTINTCKECGVEFVWAVSPGLTIRYSSDQDFELLAAKFERILDVGMKTFCLFLDDIPPQLVHPEDKEKFDYDESAPGYSLGKAHVFLTNRLLERLRSINPETRLWYCPTEYATVEPSPYLLTVGEGMHPDIGIFWTGSKVVPPAISAEDARSFAAIIRRKPLLWDNYPVNDYNRKKLNMGPLRGRDPELPSLLSGYFSNPMNESIASTIPLLTISDYLYDPAGYDPDASLKKATLEIGASGQAALYDLCDSYPAGFFTDEPLGELKSAIAKAREGNIAPLVERLSRLVELRESLQLHPETRDLAEECLNFIKGIDRYAYAALLALELRKQPGNEQLRLVFDKAFKRAEKTDTQPATQELRKFILETVG